jgi:N-methylhydantoinase A
VQSTQKTRLAVDIGGTFTDVVLASPSGQFSTKLLTTHKAPAHAVLLAIEHLLKQSQTPAGEVDAIIHGTTLAANTVIERRGARTALLVTEGHRDALETGYENRFDQYDLAIARPAPLLARKFRWPVRERMSASGKILLELDEGRIDNIVRKIQQHDIESVAIGFLHAYANPLHEQQVAKQLKRALPDLYISLSSEVSPQIREYDRLSTAVTNAYIQPLMAGYLRELEDRLLQHGLSCPLHLVMSTGGLTTIDTAVRFPVRLVESGPAGGAILAADIAKQANIDEVMSFDMGGTTAKLCLIDKGRSQRANAFEIDRLYRFIRGSGLPLRIPTIALVEIGTGGGSIATIDELQRLRVGPQSAGSEPGPACYRRGGTQATVTDADFILGHIDANDFASGQIALSFEQASRAIDKHIAETLGMETAQAAAGINEVVDEMMANAARVHAVESGRSVSDRCLIAFGGAAPLHAGRIADKLGINKIIIPYQAGVGSAVGFLLAPVSFELSRSWVMKISKFDKSKLIELLESMKQEAISLVKNSISDDDLNISMKATMRYTGQGHEVEIAITEEQIVDAPALAQIFEQHYQKLYGRLIPGVDIEIVTLIVNASETVKQRANENTEINSEKITTIETRKIIVQRGKKSIDIPCYARSSLMPGHCFQGPALITEDQTTTIVPEGMLVNIDTNKHIIMERITD